jgi:uncharacterized protein YabE (DUF348 family)
MIPNMKELFSKLLTGKWLIMSIVSMILLVGVVSYAVFELTKTTVILVVDGEEMSLKTHAKTVDELMLENDVWIPAILVYVTNDGEKTPIWTTANTIQDLIDEINIEVGDHDLIKPSLETDLVENMEIAFESAFTVTLKTDGKEKEVWTTSTTVADFLEAEKVILGKLDRVEPAQDKIVKANTEINVIRVEKVTDVVEETLNFATVSRNDSSLTKGTEREVQKGEQGKIAKHYKVVYENGKEVSRELIKTETIQKGKDRIVAVGTKQVTQPVSRGGSPGEWITFQSTAYTAYCDGCMGITSTGINLRNNPGIKVVAVDPNVIPLGSIIEIKHNGRVIGQYKAADTGTAIVGRKIDIFMSDRNAALRWGRQTVQVRIIK